MRILESKRLLLPVVGKHPGYLKVIGFLVHSDPLHPQFPVKLDKTVERKFLRFFHLIKSVGSPFPHNGPARHNPETMLVNLTDNNKLSRLLEFLIQNIFCHLNFEYFHCMPCEQPIWSPDFLKSKPVTPSMPCIFELLLYISSLKVCKIGQLLKLGTG